MTGQSLCCPNCGSDKIAFMDEQCICWDCGYKFPLPSSSASSPDDAIIEGRRAAEYLPNCAETYRCLESHSRTADHHGDGGSFSSETPLINHACDKRYPEPFQLNRAEELNKRGVQHYHSGDFKDAEREYREALSICSMTDKEELSGTRPLAAIILGNLGVLLPQVGRIDEAAEAYRKALSIHRGLAEAFFLEYAGDLDNLGLLLTNTGQYGDAENALREALAIRKRIAGRSLDHLPGVADTLTNLGLMLMDSGRYDEAKDPLQEALQIRRQLADSSPDVYLPKVADSLNNLGNLFNRAEMASNAEDAYREAIHIRNDLVDRFGDDYRTKLANSCNNLASLLRHNGHYYEAEEFYDIAIQEYRILAEMKPLAFLPTLADFLGNLGGLYLDAERYKEAEAPLIEAREINLSLMKSNPSWRHGSMISILNGLVKAFENTGRHDEAEKVYQEMVKTLKSID